MVCLEYFYTRVLGANILSGEYKKLEEIGADADNVLRGCLEKDAASRWTIEMVDEMAHSVGWAHSPPSSTQPVTPCRPGHEIPQPRRPSHSPEFHRGQSSQDAGYFSLTKPDATSARPSLSRSPSSRRRSRSASRHPLLSSERGTSSSRSRSRVALPSASMVEPTVSMSSSSTGNTPRSGSLRTSPDQPNLEDRGRRATRRQFNSSDGQSQTSSPPSPLTPVDDAASPIYPLLDASALLSSPPPLARSSSASSASSATSGSIGLTTPSKDHYREPSLARGRKALRDSPLLEVVEETARWTPSPSPGPVGRHRYNVSRDLGELIQRDRERELGLKQGGQHNRTGSGPDGSSAGGVSSWFFVGGGASDTQTSSIGNHSTSRPRL
jgi:hypothetical protein